MTRHSFTREALYALVWAEPIRTLAKRYGVSDVALAKACRQAQIPTPAPGYWAKRAHGKPVRQRALPEAAEIPNLVVLSPPAPKGAPYPAAQVVMEAAAPATPPPRPTGPHRAITAWRERNNERRRQAKDESWAGSLLGPDLRQPLEARRLRLYSALFFSLEAAGFKLEPGLGPDSYSKALKDGEEIEFRIYQRQRKGRRPLSEDEKRSSWNKDKTHAYDLIAAGDLVLKIKTYTRGGMAEGYRDQTAPLETQLEKVAADFAAGIAGLKAWRLERAQTAERYRRAAEAETRRLARQAAEAARRQALHDEAGRWRRAADLRDFIAAACASPLASEVGFEAWRAWALDEADATDPLIGGGLDLSLLAADSEG